MEKTKVVTFRIEEKVLNELDSIVSRYAFYKRSHFIAAGLRIMVELEKRGLGEQAMRFDPWWDEIVTLDFKKRRKVR